MRSTLKWTNLFLVFGATGLCIFACQQNPEPEPTVVNLHENIEGNASPKQAEPTEEQVVNVSFKGGTEDAKNLAVVFDLKKGNKLDGQRVTPVRVDAHNPTLGPANAPVTWVVFGSWECPFTHRLPPVIRAMHEAYPQTVRIVFKHVVPSHAKLGERIAKRVLMAPQQTFWTKGLELLEKGPITEALLSDSSVFPTLTAEQEKEALIRLDMDQQLATSLGIRSTPQSFINGYRLTGVKSESVFRDLIEEELRRSKGQGNP